MTKVKKVDHRIKTTIGDTVRYQILTYCFFKNIYINNSDLNLLAELAVCEDVELPKFCKLLTEKKIFKSQQSARNAVSKACKKDLILKDTNNKKNIYLNQEINVQSKGIVLLDYKILGNESEEA